MSAAAIRRARAEDQGAIGALIAKSFAGTAYGHNGEADLVRALHEDGDVELDLVAEADGQIIGQILFSRMEVVADGAAIKALALAPLSVSPAHQRRGVGSALVDHAHALLSDTSARLAFVLGDADYYTRFGYSAGLARSFTSPYAGDAFMARALCDSLRAPQSGVAHHASAFGRVGT